MSSQIFHSTIKIHLFIITGMDVVSNSSVVKFNSTALPEHRGTYTCKTANYLGYLSKQVFVDVICEY